MTAPNTDAIDAVVAPSSLGNLCGSASRGDRRRGGMVSSKWWRSVGATAAGVDGWPAGQQHDDGRYHEGMVHVDTNGGRSTVRPWLQEVRAQPTTRLASTRSGHEQSKTLPANPYKGRRPGEWAGAHSVGCGDRYALSRRWRTQAPGRWRSRAGPAQLWRVARSRRRDPGGGG